MANSPTGPVISATGISAPSFAQILAYLVSAYQSIFGMDSYLGNDSQDYQLLSVFAQGLSDANAAAIAVYNSFSPLTAQGAGLSSVVKINGLARLVPTASTVMVTIGGQAGTIINAGLIIDQQQNVWALPAVVTIPSTGTIAVLATCTVNGAVSIAPNTVSIQTAQYGWQAVTNLSASTPGNPVETDAALRLRQQISTALSSVTIFEGITAAILNLAGVTRAVGYENNTNGTNAIGIPHNSLAFIVEGGAPQAIFQTLAAKITPGIPLYAGPNSVSTVITDTDNSTRTVSYMTPVDATIGYVVTLHPLAGWTPNTEAVIAQALVNFVNAAPIGSSVGYTKSIPVAYLPGNPLATTFNIVGLTLSKNGNVGTAADVALAFNEAAICSIANVVFVLA